MPINTSPMLNTERRSGNQAGGAILIHGGSLVLKTSTFKGNKGFYGGALLNEGTSNVSDSTFEKNDATFGGGAIYNQNGSLTLATSTINNNRADFGGGIGLLGSNNVITRSTLSNNKSGGVGGGIYNSSSATFTNLTLSGNQTLIPGHEGGGYYQNGGTAVMNYTTIVNNTGTGGGGGIYRTGASSLTVQDVVLAGNTGGNCLGTFTSLGHNLSSDTSCNGNLTAGGDKNNKNAMLGALAANGGPTLTHMPNSGSPLIGKGIPIPGISVDQRGISRPQGSQVDIGSVEVQ